MVRRVAVDGVDLQDRCEDFVEMNAKAETVDCWLDCAGRPLACRLKECTKRQQAATRWLRSGRQQH